LIARVEKIATAHVVNIQAEHLLIRKLMRGNATMMVKFSLPTNEADQN
jgi:hypothetical protein